jgi:large subunit ribosomal protein L20
MRVKSNVARHRRKNRIRKAAKGARGGRSKLLRTAKEHVARGMRYAYIGRKEKKREFRRLWIQRINAAARQRGMTYSELMGALTKANVELDRRTLAEIAVSDAAAFDRIVEMARG